MILTTHMLTGALIGAEVKNPYAIAGIAVVFHFILDLIPHGDYLNKKSDYKDFWKVAVDLALGLGLVAAVFFQRSAISIDILYMQNVAIGVFFSLLPDGTTFLYWKMGVKFLAPLKRFHDRLHFYPEFSPARQFRLKNNIWDIALSFVFLMMLLLR
jgi:hypothetical protein